MGPRWLGLRPSTWVLAGVLAAYGVGCLFTGGWWA